MPKASVIIPVYKAAETLRRCVESLLSGQQKDLELILIEDCSGDESWAVCQQLAQEYPQVVCLQNERNRGVSYTRNRGLDAATGRYVLFADSDDWVSAEYAETMIAAADKNPGKLVACGYTQIDQRDDTRRDYLICDTKLLERREFYKLSEAVMLQQLWNKVFCLEDLRKAGIRFNESICMGEDYQFVMDAIERLDISECVIIGEPMYFYLRSGNGSLMDHWHEHETYEEALNREIRLEKICGQGSERLERFKEGYAYRIMWDTPLPRKEKIAQVHAILGKKRGNRFYVRQKLIRWRNAVLDLGRSDKKS